MLSFEKSAGAIIFRRVDNKIYYLLLHYVNGHWDFPKGHIEKGENEAETASREVKEETGINDLKILPGFSQEIRYIYRASGKEKENRKIKGRGTLIIKKVVFFLAETNTENIRLTEHSGFEWLTYEKALERVTYKKSKKVLEKANNYLTRKN